MTLHKFCGQRDSKNPQLHRPVTTYLQHHTFQTSSQLLVVRRGAWRRGAWRRRGRRQLRVVAPLDVRNK